MDVRIDENIRTKCNKILSYTSVKDKEKIDRLLQINADQYCNLGLESTKTARLVAEVTSRYIYRCIKEVDEDLGRFLIRANEE